MGAVASCRHDLHDPANQEKMAQAILENWREDPEEAVNDLTTRTWMEYNRAPWMSAFSVAFSRLPEEDADAIIHRLQAAAVPGVPGYGAAYLLLVVAAERPERSGTCWPSWRRTARRMRWSTILPAGI